MSLHRLKRREVAIPALLGLAYFGAALLGGALSGAAEGIPALWPPTGILLTALLLVPYRKWPLYILVCLPGSIASDLLRGETLAVALALASADIADVCVGAALVARFFGHPFKLDGLGSLAGLVGLAAMTAPVAGAAVSSVILLVVHGVPVIETATTWWLSEFAAIVLICPGLLLLFQHWPPRLSSRRGPAEALCLGAVAIAVPVGVLTLTSLPLLFTLMPVLLWAAIRFGAMEAALTNLIVAALCIALTLMGHGYLAQADWSWSEKVLLLQSYLAFLALGPSLVVALAVSESRRASLALTTSEARLAQLLDNSPVAISLFSPEGRFLVANRLYTEWYGAAAEDLTGELVRDVLPQPAAEQLVSDMEDIAMSRSAKTREHELAISGKQTRHIIATRFPVWTNGNEVAAIGTIESDVTQLKKSEDLLRQSQKMEAIGQLTGGVAHDFNNLLAIIVGSLDLSVQESEKDGKDPANLHRALAAAQRGAALTQKLLAFSRQQPLQPHVVDLNSMLKGFHGLLRRTLGEEIEIELVNGAGLWLCEVDEQQLENVILNLAVNARDAMPGGGKLTIETSNARLDDDYAAAQVEVEPGQYVMIAVTDTGTGIKPSQRDKIFDPFYTTKGGSKGTGLGLAMAYGFIKQSRGHIKVYSEVGQGTTFRIYLPRSFAERFAAEPENALVDVPRGRGERILVVEDNRDVRTLVVALLRDLGYEVLGRRDGAAALEWISSGVPIDALLTDVVLPGGMSGRNLAEILVERFPDLTVIYMSGYAANAIVHHGRVDPDVVLLQKPFRKADLARAVRRALDRRQGGPG